MSETYYGDWIPWGDRYRIERPQWSLWMVELRIDLLVTAVWMGSDWYEPDGRTLDDVGPKRLRRVYPPGSVLPEPRLASTVDPEAFRRWKWWMWRSEKGCWIGDRIGSKAVVSDVGNIECYPVQPLQNGAYVPVPWFAVGVAK